MKNLIYLSLVCFLGLCYSSCSSDDDSGQGGKNIINPPSWIIGTWTVPELGTANYKFVITKDNFIVTYVGTTYNFAEIAKQQYYTVKEISNTSDIYQIEYSLDIGSGTTQTVSYRFGKSENEITWYVDLPGGLNPAPFKLKKVN